MEKRLTLNDVWRLCLLQQAYVVKHLGELDDGSTVRGLKMAWLKKNYKEPIENGCFFCEYDDQHLGGCRSCPGRKVDKTFDCSNKAYDWHDKPKEFNTELLRLNKIRLPKKKGKK